MRIPLAAAMILIAGNLQAAFVSGTIMGSVTRTDGSLPGIVVGSSVTGSYTYDDSIVAGALFPGNPITDLTLKIGNLEALTYSDLYLVFGPALRVIQFSTPTADSLALSFKFESLSRIVGQTVSNQSFEYVTPQKFTIQGGPSTSIIEYTFTASAAPAVPEPTSWALMGLGGLGLAALLRRSQVR